MIYTIPTHGYSPQSYLAPAKCRKPTGYSECGYATWYYWPEYMFRAQPIWLSVRRWIY